MNTIRVNLVSLIVSLAVVASHSAVAQTPAATLFQAEDAASMGSATAATGPTTGSSGRGYADLGAEGSFVEWTGIPASDDGAYEIAIRHAVVNQQCQVDVYVDGAKRGAFDVLTGGGSTRNGWKRASVKVSLTKGEHTVRLVAVNGGGPNIDWMSVRGPPPSVPSPLRGLAQSVSRSTVLEPDQSLKRGEFRDSPGGVFKVSPCRVERMLVGTILV
jgi:Carbohydrate binding module (family 6)